MSTLVSAQTLVAGVSRNPERMVHPGAPLRSVLPFPISVQLLETSSGYWLFDTGMSKHMALLRQKLLSRSYQYVVPYDLDDGASALEQAVQLGIDPLDITTVVLSHFHADHIGALRDFPAATIMGLSSGLSELRAERGINAARRALFDVLLPDDTNARFQPIEELPRVELSWPGWSDVAAWRLSCDESIVAVELPGHATGQVGLLLGGPSGHFHVADAAWTSQAIRLNLPPSHLTRIVHRDWASYKHTLDRLHHLWDSGPTITPCHCGENN